MMGTYKKKYLRSMTLYYVTCNNPGNVKRLKKGGNYEVIDDSTQPETVLIRFKSGGCDWYSKQHFSKWNGGKVEVEEEENAKIDMDDLDSLLKML